MWKELSGSFTIALFLLQYPSARIKVNKKNFPTKNPSQIVRLCVKQAKRRIFTFVEKRAAVKLWRAMTMKASLLVHLQTNPSAVYTDARAEASSK